MIGSDGWWLGGRLDGRAAGAKSRRGSHRASTYGPCREERRQDREDEDVERGERGDPAVEPGRHRERGEDQLELAAADEHQGGVGGGGAAVAVDPGGDDAGDDVERERDDDRDGDGRGDRAHVARGDRQAEPEEEDRGERVAQRDEQPLDARPDPRAGHDHAGQQRSDGVRRARDVGEAGDEHPEADDEDDRELGVRRSR